MADHDHGGPHEMAAAARAAERLISRLQELVAERLSRGDELDEAEAFYALVQELETAPEITTLRLALKDDPHRFGDPTPLASATHTG